RHGPSWPHCECGCVASSGCARCSRTCSRRGWRKRWSSWTSGSWERRLERLTDGLQTPWQDRFDTNPTPQRGDRQGIHLLSEALPSLARRVGLRSDSDRLYATHQLGALEHGTVGWRTLAVWCRRTPPNPPFARGG